MAKGVAATTTMKVYSYVVRHDKGFAPNPFFGYCTLGCCKPGIRRSAEKGDWVVGLAPKGESNGIVYTMRVEEKLPFAEYWQDLRFRQKRPTERPEVSKVGDNIYEPLGAGRWRLHKSVHSKGGDQTLCTNNRDLSGEHVLISQHFGYFGRKPRPLPCKLEKLVVGRGYRVTSREALALDRILQRFAVGFQAPPHEWAPEDDHSWRFAVRRA